MNMDLQQYRLSYVDLNKGRNRRYQLVQTSPTLADGKAEHIAYFGDIGTRYQQRLRITPEYAERLVNKKINEGYIILHKGVAISKSADFSAVELHPQVRTLMQQIMKTAYDDSASKLSVDVSQILPDSIERARILLEAIRQADKTQRATLVEGYYQLIPTNIPTTARKKDEILARFSVNEEFERLQQLETIVLTQDSLTANDMIGTQYQMLGCQIDWVDQLDETFARVDAFIRHSSETYCLDELYAVRLPQEREEFEREQMQRGRVVKRLYHGTRISNYQHILRTGLVIMPQAANGSRLGRGLYFADKPERSRNYTDENMLFIADVAVGKQYQTDGELPGLPDGYDSTWGTGAWGGGADEFVVYNTNQQTLRYIARIKRNIYKKEKS